QLISMLLKKIKKEAYNKYTLMEICGGQTHSIIKHGLDYLLPSSIELIHGPGCPVCVTPETIIDQAVEVSLRDDIILCSFGDMIRVPGTKMNLQAAKALGGHVHVVYSPLD